MVWLYTAAAYLGIDNGARLRVKGEGNAGRRGAPPGDLIVFIRVKDHPELRRDGIDIHSDIDISYVDAILGSQVGAQAVAWSCCWLYLKVARLQHNYSVVLWHAVLPGVIDLGMVSCGLGCKALSDEMHLWCM